MVTNLRQGQFWNQTRMDMGLVILPHRNLLDMETAAATSRVVSLWLQRGETVLPYTRECNEIALLIVDFIVFYGLPTVFVYHLKQKVILDYKKNFFFLTKVLYQHYIRFWRSCTSWCESHTTDVYKLLIKWISHSILLVFSGLLTSNWLHYPHFNRGEWPLTLTSLSHMVSLSAGAIFST